MNLTKCRSLPDFLYLLENVANNISDQVEFRLRFSSSSSKAMINQDAYGGYIVSKKDEDNKFWIGVRLKETKAPKNMYLWFSIEDQTALDSLFDQNAVWKYWDYGNKVFESSYKEVWIPMRNPGPFYNNTVPLTIQDQELKNAVNEVIKNLNLI